MRPPRLWPDTLVGRTVLVVLIALLLTNLISLAVYTSERANLLVSARGRLLAEQITRVTEQLEQSPEAERRRILRAQGRRGVRLILSERPWIETEDVDWRTRLIRGTLRDELALDDDRRLRLAIRRFGDIDPKLREAALPDVRGRRFRPRADQPPADLTPESPILLGSLALADGTWLNFGTLYLVPRPVWTSRPFLFIGAVTLVALAVTVWAVRRAARPLTTLAGAAERLGLDVDAPALAETGPREVRTASRAFNTMQQRLQRFVLDRTQMLAAISHDLRTPITRMRLRAEFVEDPTQREKMLVDLAEMEAMVAATLAFARDDPARERPQALDLAALLSAVCADAADMGAAVQYAGPERMAIRGRAAALKRAFTNLIDNAIKYGHAARVAAAVDADAVIVTIDDDGPGLTDADRERVFEPFVRGEASRSRETGGVGLGLAVVRAAVRAHGGDVTLTNRPEGGLRATVVLPFAA